MAERQDANRIRNTFLHPQFTLSGEIRALIADMTWDDELYVLARECLKQRLSVYVWQESPLADLQTLVQLRMQHGDDLINAEVLAATLGSSGFTLPIDGTVLGLLRDFMQSRASMAAVESAGVLWCRRRMRAAQEQDPRAMLAPEAFEVRLFNDLIWWDDIAAAAATNADRHVLSWLMAVDLAKTCVGPNYSDSLQAISRLPGALLSRSTASLSLNALGRIFRENPPGLTFTFDNLFPKRRFLTASQQARLVPWHRELIRDLVLLAAETLGHTTVVEELLFQKAKPVTRFLSYCACFPADYDDGNPAIWDRLFHLAEAAKQPFLDAAESIANQTCTVLLIRRCTEVSPEEMLPFWEDIGLPHTFQQIRNADRRLKGAHDKLKVLRSITDRFIPKSSADKNLATLSKHWKSWTMRFALCYLRLSDPRAPPAPSARASRRQKGEPEALPPLLLDAFDWLRTLLDSNLFAMVWEEQCGRSRSMAKLPAAAVAWAELHAKLSDSTLTFKRMAQIVALVSSETELSLLNRTAHPVNQTPDWVVRNAPSRSWMESMSTMVARWTHLHELYKSLDDIRQSLNHLRCYMRPSAMDSLDEVLLSINNLGAFFSKNKFDLCVLLQYKDCHDDASKAHPCLAQLEPSALLAAEKCPALLAWLREMPSDSEEFSGVLQVAMSRNEMECPVDLWKVEPGNPGRPDEEKLSMLKTVHSQLHPLIFREKLLLGSFRSLTKKVLVDLVDADAQTTECIYTSQKYMDSLKELMGSGSASMAQDRISQLMQPDQEATWLCTTRTIDEQKYDSNAMGEVYLRWASVRLGQKEHRIQTRKELLDFQSNAVLGSSAQTNAADVNKFIEQFSWMRELHDILRKLHECGHFAYRSFHVEFSIGDHAGAIRSLVMEKRAELDIWLKEVLHLRESSYFLNFFTMNQIWMLVTILDTLSTAAEWTEEDLRPLRSLLRSVHPDIGTEPGLELLKLIAGRMLAIWKERSDSRMDIDSSEAVELVSTAKQTLTLCARALHATMADLSVRKREVAVQNISQFSTGTNFSEGVHVICCDDSEVLASTLGAYAHLGYVPEWPEVLLCSTTTAWEVVHIHLLRWKHASANARQDRMYSIAGIDLLPFELQRKAVAIVREGLTVSKNALLLVSANDNQHIVAQLAHFRVNSDVIPSDILRSVGEQISARFYRGVTVHTSDSAGSGKTFKVHEIAAQRQSDVIHIPVTSWQSLYDRLSRVMKACAAPGSVTLHIDVMDNSDTELNKCLFELVFLGALFVTPTMRKKATDEYFWLEPRHTVCIEIASGPLSSQLPVCALLEQSVSVVSNDTFCTDPEVLRAGMGPAFESARNDGTIVDKDSDLEIATDGFERLRYVCTALDTLDFTGGMFPYLFDASDKTGLKISPDLYDGTRLSPSRCLSLLSKYSSQSSQSPSLWCLWSFVNVMFWQLKGMHHKHSPINSACMPDKVSDRKDEAVIKQKYKGEVIKFLIHTAREFATRQTKPLHDPDEIVKVDGSEMQRWEWKGDWIRQPFQCDGHPVFRRGGAFFMYFRGLQKQWVIDDGVYPTGPVFSKSETEDLQGVWSTNASWEVNNMMKVKKAKVSKGYNGEALKVSDCFKNEKGASVGAKEDGIYLRQPPADDIENHPHYVMIKKMPDGQQVRRHIFFAKEENTYALCPVCTMDQGAHGLCVKPEQICGDWKTIPPNHRENPNLKIVRKGSLSAEQTTVDANSPDVAIDNTLKWNDSNHECLLFSNVSHVVSFLSLDPKKMRESMHPGLRNYLEKNRINIGEDLDRLNERHHVVLSSLTEVERSGEEADALMRGGYCLTGDALLKMLAIFVRVRCGIPVVLMGECGCGKTMLIRYLCKWLGVSLLILDINGGTEEKEIVSIFRKAESALEKHDVGDVYVFLDEINTCKHMGLITEIMIHRSLNGKRLRDGIQVLAALNPYRYRAVDEETPGLVFQAHKGKGAPAFDPMTRLVYRVHPIPQSLRDFIFDFGSLNRPTERLYIQSMTANQLSSLKLEKDVTDLIAGLILEAQCFVRAEVKDVSATSLRDVNRCLRLLKWFRKHVSAVVKVPAKPAPKRPARVGKADTSDLETGIVLALAFVYYYRLPKQSQRDALWCKLQTSRDIKWSTKGVRLTSLPSLRPTGQFSERLNAVQSTFCDNIVIKEEGIAMNAALMENLFVLIISILNKIPVFLVGKPGSSKTLALQVIQSNLQGKRSISPFWQKYPSVYIFQYQCSPMSDSGSIQHQFDMAVRYQKHAQDTITVLLLDEVGLAEHSPEMPLKVLHGMLVDPKIAIVGLSNWVLDPAKMNRAILLQRTEPTEDDIEFTGQCIMTETTVSLTKSQDLQAWLAPLARAYHEVYVGQEGRDFVGMRDYYNLVKLLRSEMKRNQSSFEPQLLAFALCRNFGGKPELMDKILESFMKHCFELSVAEAIGSAPAALDLVRANMADGSARHLMLLTRNSAALNILFGCGILDPTRTHTLVGSDFSEDNSELHLIQQINSVKQAMAQGSTIVLLNHDNIYEALYDVLNQRYVLNSDVEAGTDVKMLRLAIGSRSQLCKVEDGFRIVVIVEQAHAYRSLDLPLLNRFEKQVVRPKDVLGPALQAAEEELSSWLETILVEAHARSYQQVICGFHDSTLASALLVATNYDQANLREDTLDKVKRQLLYCIMPVNVIASESLLSIDRPYFEDLSNLQTAVERLVLPEDGCGAQAVIFTHSPASHLQDAKLQLNTSADGSTMTDTVEIAHLQLAELESERQLVDFFSRFLRDSSSQDRLLLVQCDPIACKQPLIDHARYLLVKSRTMVEGTRGRGARHVVFLVHMPLGVKDRERYYSLDFNKNWIYLFVDDIRVSNINIGLATREMLEHSIYTLCTRFEERLGFEGLLTKKFQLALATCTVPYVESDVGAYRHRLGALRGLVEVPAFRSLFKDLVVLVLQNDEGFKETSALCCHRHISLNKQESLGGSLRQSLAMALEIIIVRAMASVLHYLDRDFNLAHMVNDANSDLWLAAAHSQVILTPDAVVRAGKLSESTFQVENHGRDGPVISRVPFSYKMSSLLGVAQHREQLEGKPFEDQCAHMASVASMLLPAPLLEGLDSWAGSVHEAYLHDVVGYFSPCFHGLSTEEKYRIYRSTLLVADSAALSTVHRVHVGIWYNEYRLFNICSVLPILSAKSRPAVVNVIEAAAPAPVLSFTVTDSEAALRLADLDLAFVGAVIDVLFLSLKEQCAAIGRDVWSKWLSEFSNISSFLGNMLLGLSRVLLPGALADVWSRWIALDVVSIFLREIILPSKCYGAGERVAEVLEIASSASVHSVGVMEKILASVRATSSDDALVSSFLRRYVKEAVFGNNYSLYGYNAKVEDSLVSLLVNLLNGSADLRSSQSIGSLNFYLKRSFVQDFMVLTSQRSSVDFLQSTEACQLYLQLAHDMEDTSGPVTEAVAKSVQNQGTTLPPAHKARDWVDGVALVQAALRQYAFDLVQAEDKSTVDLTPCVSDMLSPEAYNTFPQVVQYVLKQVLRLAGPAGIADIVLGANLSWVPRHTNPADVTDVAKTEVPDPFVWIGAEKAYDTICEAVRVTANSSANDLCALLDGDELVKPQDTIPDDTIRSLVLASALSQYVFNPRGLFDDNSTLYRSWLEEHGKRQATPSELPFYYWIAGRCQSFPRETPSEKMHLQLAMQISMVALTKRRSWVNTLLFQPEKVKNMLLPSMPNDLFTVAYRAMPNLGWYKCPNGHMYSVGECTMPMQTAKCQECGVPIGGQNHVSVKGVERIKVNQVEDIRALPGYTLKNASEPSSRLSTLTDRLFRFLVHSALCLSLAVARDMNENAVTKVVFEQSEQPRKAWTYQNACRLVLERRDQDWEELKTSLKLDDRDLAVALHLLLIKWVDTSLRSPDYFVDGSVRCRYENEFNALVIEPILGSKLQKNLEKANEDLSESGAVAASRTCLGDDLWAKIHETDNWHSSTRGEAELLWRYRQRAAFDYFQRSFSNCHSNQTEYPVLAAILSQEAELSSMHHLADVLAWHQLLFQAYPAGSLTRPDAATSTNTDAIQRLPEGARAEAETTLALYLEAFNEELARIELFQCKDNPWLTKFPNGRVDLSGGRSSSNPMVASSPLRFSLPSMQPSEMDVYGTCTIQILALLQQRHNVILEKLVKEEAEVDGVPPISYLTPREVIMHHTIRYSRKEHLLPLLQIFSEQSLGHGEGTELTFDYGEIEKALINTVLAGKRPIAVHTRHFQYVGEAKSSGSLVDLRSRIAQTKLPEAVMEMIIAEVDSQMHLKQLLRMLEVIVSFIATVGDGSVQSLDGSIKLAHFISSSQLLADEDWAECSTTSIDEHVRLQHLVQLFALLEEHMHGNPLDLVPDVYRQPLAPKCEEALRSQAKFLNIDALLSSMHEFLINRLAPGPLEYYKPSYPLFDSLFDSVIAVEDEGWFEHFPESMTLADTMATYDLLRELAGR